MQINSFIHKRGACTWPATLIACSTDQQVGRWRPRIPLRGQIMSRFNWCDWSTEAMLTLCSFTRSDTTSMVAGALRDLPSLYTREWIGLKVNKCMACISEHYSTQVRTSRYIDQHDSRFSPSRCLHPRHMQLSHTLATLHLPLHIPLVQLAVEATMWTQAFEQQSIALKWN